MAIKTQSQLNDDALVIRNEEAIKANTAVRLGQMFVDFIDSIYDNSATPSDITDAITAIKGGVSTNGDTLGKLYAFIQSIYADIEPYWDENYADTASMIADRVALPQISGHVYSTGTFPNRSYYIYLGTALGDINDYEEVQVSDILVKLNKVYTDLNTTAKDVIGAINELFTLVTDLDSQTAYDNSNDGKIITDATRGAAKIQGGTGTDTDNSAEFLNNSGVVTAFVQANGATTCKDYVSKGLASSDLGVYVFGTDGSTGVGFGGMGFFGAGAWNGTTFVKTRRAGFRIRPTSAWTGSNNGAIAQFEVTQDGTTTTRAIAFFRYNSLLVEEGTSKGSVLAYAPRAVLEALSLAASRRFSIRRTSGADDTVCFEQDSDDVQFLIEATNEPAGNPTGGLFHWNKSDVPKWKDPSGVIYRLDEFEKSDQVFSALTIGATTTIDGSNRKLLKKTLALTQTTTLSLSNWTNGTYLVMIITNSSGSSYDVVLPTGHYPKDSTILKINTILDGESYVYSCVYDGSRYEWNYYKREITAFA